MVCFKTSRPEGDSLEHRFLDLCGNLIANGKISVDSEIHNNDIDVAYVDISNACHNKLRVIVYTKSFALQLFNIVV